MRRLFGSGSGVAGIGVAIGVSSVAGYALLTLVGRLLTPGQFGLFVVFWGVLFGIGSSLSILEQETARRTVTGDGAVAPTAGTVTMSAAVLAVVAGAVTLIPAISHRLYGAGNEVIGLAVVLAAAGFGIQFAVRGTLIGSGAVRGYAAIIVAEAAVRLGLLAVVVAVFGLTLTSAAFVVATGAFVWLLWLRRARSVLRLTGRAPREWWAGSRRAVSLMLGAALIASLITGYPSLVTVLTGDAPGAAGGAVFAVLTISRVPLLFVSPVQAVAVPAVVRWRAQEQAGGPPQLRRVLAVGTLAVAALAVLGGIGGWLLGPWVVGLVYGPAYQVQRSSAALLILASILLGWVSLMSAALIALAAVRRMILMWSTAFALTAIWLVVSPFDIAQTTAIGGLVGPLAGIACGVPMLWSLSSAVPPVPVHAVPTGTDEPYRSRSSATNSP